MVSFKLATSLLLASIGHTNASFEFIAGYEPGSLVTDHNAIDLDQQAMEIRLAEGTPDSYAVAQNIYELGGNSKSYAILSVSPLPAPLEAKTEVSGPSVAGPDVFGKLLSSAAAGATQIQVQYNVNEIQASHVGCRVGGLQDTMTDGCFASSGALNTASGPITYTYNVGTDNKNKRTLQGFSTGAQEKMAECTNCPYATYKKYFDYYGQYDYANQWVLAAFAGSQTSFSNGNANFGLYGNAGRKEAIKKGTAYMNVWMYVIREMEDAIDDCKTECNIENCNDDPVHAWDEAVAFYSGSIEGTDGSGDGVLLHQLADKRCKNFKTCGDLSNEESGLSHVNIEIFRQFNAGLRNLREGNCPAVKDNKLRIEQLMAVPLIQGTLRYAHITDYSTELSEKAEAEGAVFAASVLPLVDACDADAAAEIYRNMQVGQGGNANFKEVKRAFESVYSCLNVRCEDVGGLYDSSTGGYLQNASPCGSSKSESNANVGLIAGLSAGGVALVALLMFFSAKCCGTSQIEYSSSNDVKPTAPESAV